VSAEDLLSDAIVIGIFLLVAFPVHEFSHAWTAYKLGDSTARYQGRLTLNPIVHFDPIGGLLLAVSTVLGTGIGWAKPTPVNPYNLRNGRRDEALVALAGPISNLVMAAAVAIPMRFILATPDLLRAVSTPGSVAEFVFGVAFTFVQIDVLLLIFNLLPIPPLDGWRGLLGLVDARTAANLRPFEQYGFIVLILLIFFAPTFIGQIVNEITRFLLGF
jgi:Zn-dependent protease